MAKPLLIQAIDEAVKNPAAVPDRLVLAIFQNDLKTAIIEASHTHNIDLAGLLKASSYVSCHITGNQINAVVKKWGRK